PISRAEFAGKTEGEALYRLFFEWTKAQSVATGGGSYEGYKFLPVTEDGVTRYKIERPAPAKPDDEEKVFRKMLKMSGLDEKAIDKRVEEYKKQSEQENENKQAK
ncbi:MAG: hypothetical protein ABSB91_09000, partial [Sedimentisphaerales bacterium]